MVRRETNQANVDSAPWLLFMPSFMDTVAAAAGIKDIDILVDIVSAHEPPKTALSPHQANGYLSLNEKASAQASIKHIASSGC